jgi:hypothetical protein
MAQWGVILLVSTALFTSMAIHWLQLLDRPHVWMMACNEPGFANQALDRPTKDFINRHLDIYGNPNITQFVHSGKPWPKNRLVDTC